jgi:hypothetical protein
VDDAEMEKEAVKGTTDDTVVADDGWRGDRGREEGGPPLGFG